MKIRNEVGQDQHEELQTLLETADAIANDGISGINEDPPSSGKGAVINKKKPRIHTKFFRQWTLEGDGAYSPVGMSVKTLPAGSYTIQATEEGIHLRENELLTDNLVDLEDGNTVKVINGIETFWTKRDKYDQYGLLFKRGILLWGPAGSGKTSTVAFLAKSLIARDGIVLICGHPAIAVMGLQALRSIEPDRPIIIIFEDIEELIRQYEEHGILSILDGEHQTDNVVSLATTNYPEKLGARIVNRPSRFDEVIKIGMPSEHARYKYLEHLGVSDNVRAKWVLDTEGFSIAHVKELFVAVYCLGNAYEETLERLKSMKRAPHSIMREELGYSNEIGVTASMSGSASAAGLSNPKRR